MTGFIAQKLWFLEAGQHELLEAKMLFNYLFISKSTIKALLDTFSVVPQCSSNHAQLTHLPHIFHIQYLMAPPVAVCVHCKDSH